MVARPQLGFIPLAGRNPHDLQKVRAHMAARSSVESVTQQEQQMTLEIEIDDRTIRARRFASQIMAIIQDCVSDKTGAESRLIHAAYDADVEITRVAVTNGVRGGET